MDIQRNLRDSHKLISSSIEEMIRKLLPVKTILQEYLGMNCEDDPDNDISSNISEVGKRNLKRMVKQDMPESVRLDEQYSQYRLQSCEEVDTPQPTTDNNQLQRAPVSPISKDCMDNNQLQQAPASPISKDGKDNKQLQQATNSPISKDN